MEHPFAMGMGQGLGDLEAEYGRLVGGHVVLGKIALKHALAGGVTAALLWEGARHLLVWYFSTLSLVNVIYGSLATAVVALLTFEVAGIILLFGAQVIAEFERCSLGQEGRSDAGFET